MEHTEKYVKNTHTDGTYPERRHPRTYLNKESWNNDIVCIKEDEKAVIKKNEEEKSNKWAKKQYIETLRRSGKTEEEINLIIAKYHQ